LKKRLDAGDKLVVIDMRHALEARFHPYTIPGAKRFTRNEAASYVKSLPEDQDVVVFCNCPREAGSVSFAHAVSAGTARHVWPLEGGLDDWQKHNFPTQPLSQITDNRSTSRQ
jgi:rhodanese-related sulfurtransferase